MASPWCENSAFRLFALVRFKPRLRDMTITMLIYAKSTMLVSNELPMTSR